MVWSSPPSPPLLSLLPPPCPLAVALCPGRGGCAAVGGPSQQHGREAVPAAAERERVPLVLRAALSPAGGVPVWPAGPVHPTRAALSGRLPGRPGSQGLPLAAGLRDQGQQPRRPGQPDQPDR